MGLGEKFKPWKYSSLEAGLGELGDGQEGTPSSFARGTQQISMFFFFFFFKEDFAGGTAVKSLPTDARRPRISP